MDYLIKIFLICFLSAVFILGGLNPIEAYVMQSSNYKMQSDSSLNPSSGIQTSENYHFIDTMGQVSSGISNSESYKIKAGFQQMQEVSLSISSPSDISMSPDIPGISGGSSTGSAIWTVQTDCAAGFDMKIKSSSLPALKLPPDGTYYFDDYNSTPTFGWNIASNSAKFGFSLTPSSYTDAVTTFLDNGSSCGSGNNIGNCWRGFEGTNYITLIHRQSRTGAIGENEQINFKAESNKFIKSGEYIASITITVLSN